MSNESDLEETTGGGFKRPEPKSKVKDIVKKTTKGAREIGSRVTAGASSLAKKGYESVKKTTKGAREIGSRVTVGASSLAKKGYESYKQYTSPEAKQARLDAEERKLEREVRIAQQKAKIRRLQPPRRGGGSFLGGFQGIDMQDVLGGGNISKSNTMNNLGGGLGGMDFGGNFNSAMGSIIGSKAVSVRQPKRYKTIKTKVIGYRRYKPRGARKYRSKRIVRYKKRRVAIGSKAPRQQAVFDPFSQF